MLVFGTLLIFWGLIVAITPESFAAMWSYTTANGTFYWITGAILVIAGAVSPVYSASRRVNTVPRLTQWPLSTRVRQGDIVLPDRLPDQPAANEVHADPVASDSSR